MRGRRVHQRARGCGKKKLSSLCFIGRPGQAGAPFIFLVEAVWNAGAGVIGEEAERDLEICDLAYLGRSMPRPYKNKNKPKTQVKTRTWGTPNVEAVVQLFDVMITTDLIADSANGANEGTVGAGIEFLAQIVDVDIDDVGDGIRVQTPDLFNDGIARDGAAGVAQEILEQGIFLGTQFNGAATAADFVRDAIYFEIL